MIAIVSSAPSERAAFASLCETRDWPAIECDSARALARNLSRHAPRLVLARHKLSDGYSDDVIAGLRAAGRLPETKVMVLVAAGTASSIEARQLALGADCVQRDPVRIDVLLAYLTKYYAAPDAAPARAPVPAGPLSFAGANICREERLLRLGRKSVRLTPREMALAEIFGHSHGEVLTYETLYADIFGRRFRGDTSNLRVLVGRLTASAAKLEIPLRRWITAIPKTGYRYEAARRAGPLGGKKPTAPLRTAA